MGTTPTENASSQGQVISHVDPPIWSLDGITIKNNDGSSSHICFSQPEESTTEGSIQPDVDPTQSTSTENPEFAEFALASHETVNPLPRIQQRLAVDAAALVISQGGGVNHEVVPSESGAVGTKAGDQRAALSGKEWTHNEPNFAYDLEIKGHGNIVVLPPRLRPDGRKNRSFKGSVKGDGNHVHF